MLVDSPEPWPATASAPSAGQNSCWSLIPKPCHGKGANSGGWRAEQGCGCSLGASAVPVPHMELVVDGCGVIPVLLGGGHTQSTLCQEGSWVLGQVCDAVGREPFPGTPDSEPWPSSALLIPTGHTRNIPRNIPGQPSLPSTFQGLLSLLLALLLPHHLRVSCHIPGLSLPSSMSIITTASPSAHPHGISLLTTLPASLPGTQGHLGSPALSPCARAPGIAPNCSSQATDRHFWEESDLHNIPRQGSASLQEQQKELGTPPCLAPMVVTQRTPVVLQE